VAHSRIPDTDYSEFDQINRIATQRLANAAKSIGVERFMYISSVRAQTGASAMRTVRESDDPSPTNQYGREKLAAERAIQAVGVPFTIFRPIVIYGPRPKGNMRIVVRLARSPLPLPVFNNRRSLLAVDNLISAIVFALNNPDSIGETYPVADSKPMTMSEIFTILRTIQGRRLKSVHIPHALIRLALMLIGRTDLWSRFGGELIVDTGKLEAAGWRPAVETYDGLREMVSAENEESPQP
jgi:UDP-glucose 4-epimerase